MSHAVQVKLMSDQVINVNGHEINVHDIETIVINDSGKIIQFSVRVRDGIFSGMTEYIFPELAETNKAAQQ